MEKQYGDKFILPVLLTELVGTCLLMLAVNLAGDDTLVVSLTYFALIVCCYEVSGGHLNPAISIGVYIAEKRYSHNLLFMIVIIMAQTLGALFALGFGYLIRVTVNRDDDFFGDKRLEPNVYAEAPPLLIATDGMPSYGQIMLSETIGTFILVLTSVSARGFIKRGPSYNMTEGALTMAVALAAVQRMFRETSGGVVNPAVAFAKIIWQEFTLNVDSENNNSQWTYEYATSFFVGPISGAMLAGVVYNMLRHSALKMDSYVKPGTNNRHDDKSSTNSLVTDPDLSDDSIRPQSAAANSRQTASFTQSQSNQPQQATNDQAAPVQQQMQ